MNAVLVGATGLIGGYLLQELINDSYFEKVIALTRRPLELINARLENVVVDFDKFSELESSYQNAAVIFVAIGTTQKKVKGDKIAYRKVDYDITLDIARVGVQKGAQTFVLVSAIGANPKANNFYTKLKGEIEQAVSNVGYKSIYIFRPSVLLGKREEFRLLEKIAQGLMKSVSKLFLGTAAKYKAVHAQEVARAMLIVGKEANPGRHILCYDDFMKHIKP